MKEYTSLGEKKKSYDEIAQKHGHQSSCNYWCVNTKEELSSLLNFLEGLNPRCIFRGINEAKYMMFTSYQVNAQLGKIRSASVVDFIQKCINELKITHKGLLKRYHYSMDVLDSDFIYISLLQHYGAPSPFLDFTSNWQNALFFAIDKAKTNDGDEINDYISLYWIDLSNMRELATIRDLYAQGICDAVKMAVNFLKETPADLGTNNLKLENFFAWSNSENRGEGISKVPLAYVDNNHDQVIAKTSLELNELLEDIKKQAQLQNHDIESLLNNFNEECRKSVKKNIKIVNLNEVAQDGCFILYNPQNIDEPLEDYWVSSTTFENLPELHCVNIHKSLVGEIRKFLHKNGITKQSIYPNLGTITKRAWRSIQK